MDRMRLIHLYPYLTDIELRNVYPFVQDFQKPPVSLESSKFMYLLYGDMGQNVTESSFSFLFKKQIVVFSILLFLIWHPCE